jgi:hypothetical protein
MLVEVLENAFTFKLKGGNSYLRVRKKDGAEIFTIHKQSWVKQFLRMPYPVMIVIGTFVEKQEDLGDPEVFEVRWMNLSSYLKEASQNGVPPARQVVFTGESMDLKSILRQRDTILHSETTNNA